MHLDRNLGDDEKLVNLNMTQLETYDAFAYVQENPKIPIMYLSVSVHSSLDQERQIYIGSGWKVHPNMEIGHGQQLTSPAVFRPA